MSGVVRKNKEANNVKLGIKDMKKEIFSVNGNVICEKSECVLK